MQFSIYETVTIFFAPSLHFADSDWRELKLVVEITLKGSFRFQQKLKYYGITLPYRGTSHEESVNERKNENCPSSLFLPLSYRLADQLKMCGRSSPLLLTSFSTAPLAAATVLLLQLRISCLSW